MDMSSGFTLIPKGFSQAGDDLEQIWLACARQLTEDMACLENHPPETWKSPEENPCKAARNSTMSCIDKTRNWEAWSDLLKCRETQRSQAAFKQKAPSAPDPVSCHDQAQVLSAHRATFFDAIFTREVSVWAKELEKVKSTCKEFRLKYVDCAKKEGENAIACLDLAILNNDCVSKAVAPIEFEALRKCRSANPSGSCASQKAALKKAMDLLAAPATDSLGLQKIDYMRYGGPFRTFDSQVYPLTHIPEAQERMEKKLRSQSPTKR